MEGWVELTPVPLTGDENEAPTRLLLRPQAIIGVREVPGCALLAHVFIAGVEMAHYVQEPVDEVLALIAKAMPRRQVAVPVPKGLVVPR